MIAPVTALVLSACTLGQQIPPPEPGTAAVNVQFQNKRLKVSDVASGAEIVTSSGGMDLWESLGSPVAPTIAMNPQPTGCDLIYTFSNTTGQPQQLGVIWVGPFTLGNQIEYFDFRGANIPVKADFNSYIAQGWSYPDDLYSPVAVLRNDKHAVGVSLHYPLLQHKHDAVVAILGLRGHMAPESGKGPGWGVAFRICEDKRHGGDIIKYPAVLNPGETRQYVVSIRVTPDPNDWIRTLVPYRNYFRSLYGHVAYERDPRPVYAVAPANIAYMSGNSGNSSPYGYEPGVSPEVHGWGKWAKRIRDGFPGAGRVMMWVPTGLYEKNPDRNYPFQFASRFHSNPKMATAFDPTHGLRSLSTTTRNFGMWWGYAATYSPAWDVPEHEPLNIHNPTHVEAALKEFDAAVAAGATTIGLDSFTHGWMPVWDQIEWLDKLRQRAPGVRFVGEPSVSDIMHREIASFHSSWTEDPNPPNIQALTIINNPNYLSDFLLPGHETWSGMVWHLWRQHFNQTPSINQVRQDVNRMAGFGYVPVIFWDNVPNANSAAESWLTTIPVDLRESLGGGGGGSGGGSSGSGSSGSGGGSTAGGGSNVGGGSSAGGGSTGSGSGGTAGAGGGNGSGTTSGGSGGSSGGGTSTFTGGGNPLAPPAPPERMKPSAMVGGRAGGGGGGGAGGGGGGGGGGGVSSSAGYSVSGAVSGSASGSSVATVTNPDGSVRTTQKFSRLEIEAAIARARSDMLIFGGGRSSVAVRPRPRPTAPVEKPTASVVVPESDDK